MDNFALSVRRVSAVFQATRHFSDSVNIETSIPDMNQWEVVHTCETYLYACGIIHFAKFRENIQLVDPQKPAMR